MIHPQPRSVAAAFLAAGAFVLLPGLSPVSSTGLQASGNAFVVGLDSDGDGLDDALEMRLGTHELSRDTDLDGLEDLEELLLGSDPRSRDDLAEFPATPSVYMDVYAAGDRVVFQVAAFSQTSIDEVRFGWATPNGATQATMGQLHHLIGDAKSTSGWYSDWGIKVVNLSIPRSKLDSIASMGIGVVALVDGEWADSSVQLGHLNSVLCQLRSDLVSLQNGQGGVFPVEPGGQIPSGSPDEVCVQTLVPSAYLPGGKIEYQVTEAKCEALVDAICLPGCANSALEVLIGIDILSLIN